MKKGIQIGVVVVGLIAAVYLAIASMSGGTPEDTNYWRETVNYQCPECSTVTRYTPEEHEEAQAQIASAGEFVMSPPCSQCGNTDGISVYVCPHCDAAFPPVGHAGLPEKCPSCNETLDASMEQK